MFSVRNRIDCFQGSDICFKWDSYSSIRGIWVFWWNADEHVLFTNNKTTIFERMFFLQNFLSMSTHHCKVKVIGSRVTDQNEVPCIDHLFNNPLVELLEQWTYLDVIRASTEMIVWILITCRYCVTPIKPLLSFFETKFFNLDGSTYSMLSS